MHRPLWPGKGQVGQVSGLGGVAEHEAVEVGVGAEGGEFRVVLDFADAVALADGAGEEGDGFGALAGDFRGLGHFEEDGGTRFGEFFEGGNLGKGSGAVAALSKIGGEGGAGVGVVGNGFEPVADEVDGASVGFDGLGLIAGKPAAGIGEVAPIEVAIAGELDGFLEVLGRFVKATLKELKSAEVAMEGGGGGDFESALEGVAAASSQRSMA